MKEREMGAAFEYLGQIFQPYRKMSQSEQEQPLWMMKGRMTRYTNDDFEALWNLDEFYEKANTDSNLFIWNGKMITPSWDTFYMVSGLM